MTKAEYIDRRLALNNEIADRRRPLDAALADKIRRAQAEDAVLREPLEAEYRTRWDALNEERRLSRVAVG